MTRSVVPVNLAEPSADRTVPVPGSEFQGKLEPNYYCRAWNPTRKKYCRQRAGFNTAHSGRGRCFKHGGMKKTGDARMRGGGRSILPITRLNALIEQHLADPKLFDISRTLAVAKALMDDYIARYYELTPALMAWYGGSEPLSEEKRLALLACLDELEELYGTGEMTELQATHLSLARGAVAQLSTPRIEKPRQVPDISEAVGHADVISKIIHRVNQHHSQTAISYARLAAFMFELSRQLDGLVPDRVQLQKINDAVLKIRI